MIFYLKPPKSIINLRNFNSCCFTRLKYFIEVRNYDEVDNIYESVIPETKLDKIGHFILRCFCLCNPEMIDFVLEKETELFLFRLEQQTVNELKRSCKMVIRDIRCFEKYKELNLLTKYWEKPYFGSMLLSSLEKICQMLLHNDISFHYKMVCDETCEKYQVEGIINFRNIYKVCLLLVKSREIKIHKSIANVPCSQWNILIKELFIHHYHFGLSVISSILNYISNDVRWLKAFENLKKLYNSHLYRKPLPQQQISARQVEYEKQFFPPCMSHLLSVLRNNHRLSHNWRYYFSLFLKDIGLTVEESINFWKSEYSQSCTTEATCTHSWQANERKYRYSIRHLYGMEGSKRKVNSKACKKFQEMSLGMKDEGGCPFVHFDETSLLSTLNNTVHHTSDIVSRIIDLKNKGEPTAACFLHMATLSQTLNKNKFAEDFAIKFESPIECYFNVKSCISHTLDW